MKRRMVYTIKLTEKDTYEKSQIASLNGVLEDDVDDYITRNAEASIMTMLDEYHVSEDFGVEINVNFEEEE